MGIGLLSSVLEQGQGVKLTSNSLVGAEVRKV
jgi:hypothetical protein